jgi:dynein heavy chain
MEEEIKAVTGKPDPKATAPKTEAGRLRSNFNVQLLKVMHEVNYWNKIQTIGLINMPHAIVRLLTENEQLRKLRENVMTVVRLYNNI